MKDIRSAVRHFILSQCCAGESPARLRDDARLREDGTLDSIALVQLVSLIEAEANIEISGSDIVDGNFGSIDEMVAFVSRRTSHGG